MKKCFILLSLIIMSVLNMGCDDVLSDASLLALASDSGDKSQVIMEITGKVAKQLISEGKAKTVTYKGDNEFFKGKTFIMPVEPYTYDDMQYALELALKSKFGDRWVKYVNAMLNNITEKQFDDMEIPREISPININQSYTINETQDTDWVPYFRDNVKIAEAKAAQHSWWVPVPFWILGGLWWYGFTNFVQDFRFIAESDVADSLTFSLYDVNGNPYTWASNKLNTIIFYDRNEVTLTTTDYVNHWSQKQLYTTGWDIIITDNETAEVWSERF